MINNKYLCWYTNIINRAVSQNRKHQFKTYEKHHIVPKSIGGSDDKSNLVLLTFKEHFVCHHLLTKFTQGSDKSKMIFAFWGMSNKWGRTNTDCRLTSKVYAALKEEVAVLISNNNKGKSYPVSDQTRKKLSDSKQGNKNPMFSKPAHNKGSKRPGVGGRKKGTVWSDSERQHQSLVRSAPGYYDFLKDPNRAKKISNSLKGRSGPASGKKWYNNGVVETYAEIAPTDYVVGRLKRPQLNKIGMKWYNNGIVNRQFKDGQVEEGFIRGRISKK